MKKIILAVLFCAHSASSAVGLQADQFGLGLMIGSMTSITGKYAFSAREAVDFGLGFASHSTILYADYLWHVPGIFGKGTRFGRETNGYIGGGPGLAFWDSYECGRWGCDKRTEDNETGVFIRALFGFEWYPPSTRFGVFAELGPTFLLAPATSGDLDIGIGGRYYF